MKKFYTLLFTTVLLLTSFISKGQGTYVSISTNNVTHYTLDDPRFWVGGVPPPALCTGCTIKINSDVTVVPYQGALPANGGVGTTSQVPFADDPSLDHINLTNTVLNVYGATTLTINTNVNLLGTSSITIGNDPISQENIFINDQVVLGPNANLRLANEHTLVDASNLNTKTTILGPYDEIGNSGFKAAGIYGQLTAPMPGGTLLYTQILELNGIGSEIQQYTAPGGEPYYTINCSPEVVGAPNICDFGLVSGPAQTQPGGTYGVIFVGAAVLPVKLVQFVGSKGDDGAVNLKWSTSQESNALNYEVQRSGDQTEFKTIGTVKAKGFSSTTTDYSYSDKLPLDGSGYYRLKMNDIDGKFTISKTIAISSNPDAQPLVVYNNPFNDQIRLKVNVNKAQNLIFTLSDMQGKTYLTQSYNAQAGDNMINLQPKAGSGAMYILRVNGNTYNQTIKLQKQ